MTTSTRPFTASTEHPIAYAAVAYGVVWLSGIGAVDLGRFHTNALRFIALGTLISLSSALGEELG